MRRRDALGWIGIVFGIAAVHLPDARAEPARPVVGFVNVQTRESVPREIVGFRAGLAELGFVDGRNVGIEFAWADGRYDRIPSLIDSFVQRRAAVIIAAGGNLPGLLAKRATTTSPIVFMTAADPVAAGLVPSLNRPGGNIIGLTNIAGALGPKRLELIHQALPAATTIGMIVNPKSTNSARHVAAVTKASGMLGQQLHAIEARNEQEIEAAFATLNRLNVQAVLVNPDPVFMPLRSSFVALAARYAIPAFYYSREYVDAGGLISYGTSFPGMYRQAGRYVSRILRGEPAGRPPVVQPTQFELVIYLKAAKALGLSIPPTLLARADEVIE